jgi:starch synthase
MTLTVCLLASEAAPLSKTGGLADVSSALTKYLHAAGHDVRLFTPLYSSIDRGRFPMRPVEGLEKIEVAVGPHRYVMSVMTTPMPGSSASIYLIDCPALYSRATLYTADPDEHLRFLAFTRAVFTCCQRSQWSPQILHCNDWHTAFAPLFLKAAYDWDRSFAGTRTVLTIHNIGYQGIFPAASIEDLSLGPKN